MKRLLLSLFLMLVSPAVYAAESIYTKIDLDKDCVFHSAYELGGSAYCTGLKGHPVHFSEGDLRQMVRFGHLRSLLGQRESFGQFNRINDTIEWRVADGKPYATILRWFIENSDDNGQQTKAIEGQVLVVSKVADSHNGIPGSCVVGYVDARANANANEIARRIADTMARDFRCIEDNAEFHGVRGQYSGDPVSSFE